MSTSMDDITRQNEVTIKCHNPEISELSLSIEKQCNALTLEQHKTSLAESGIELEHNGSALEQSERTETEIKAQYEALTLEKYKTLLLGKTDSELMAELKDLTFEQYKKLVPSLKRSRSLSESKTDKKTSDASEILQETAKNNNIRFQKKSKTQSRRARVDNVQQLLYKNSDLLEQTLSKIYRLITLIENNFTGRRVSAQVRDALNNNIKYSKIRHLDLSKRKITNKTAAVLAVGLAKNDTLINLNLSNNGINDTGAKDIVNALLKNTTLEQLDIGNNKITDEGANSFAHLIKQDTKLKFLHLEKNKITNEGFEVLVECYLASEKKYLFLIEGENDSEIDDAIRNIESKSKEQAEEIRRKIKEIIEKINEKMLKNSLNTDVDKYLISDDREVRIIEDEELGRGGFGVVYKAYFRQSPVAVKMMKENVPQRDEKKAREEAHLMSILVHDNIVQYRGYYEGPRFSIVMEYTPLGSMNKFLGSGKTNLWQDSYSIMLDVARGLDHIHRYECSETSKSGNDKIGILHRDLKASNVLIFIKNENQICAKLSDFGLSSVVSNVSSSSAFHAKGGTGFHRAPEIRGVDSNSMPITAKRATFEADIYSYGTILFEWIYYPYEVPEFVNEDNVPKSVNPETIQAGSVLKNLMVECCPKEPEQRKKLAVIIETLERAKQGGNDSLSSSVSESSSGLRFMDPLSRQQPSMIARPATVTAVARERAWSGGNSFGSSSIV